MASVVPTSATPVTATGACGFGSRSFNSDCTTNTSPGAFKPARPTDVKIGGATRPISSVLRIVGEGIRPIITGAYYDRHLRQMKREAGPVRECNPIRKGPRVPKGGGVVRLTASLPHDPGRPRRKAVLPVSFPCPSFYIPTT